MIVHSPIALELLRTQLQSIADESAETVIRTAISPLVNEAKDCGSTLLDGDGNLLAGGGTGSMHWIACSRAVRATIDRYGDMIGEGDVFLANDPYNGGGLHPADAVIQRPIFVGGLRVAWAAFSAHMMDMGGMSVGSWSPQATECYQEAFRIPPVRIIKGGEEVAEIWELFRVNVRVSVLVEMDLRSLAAGSFVAQERLRTVAEDMGAPAFVRGLRALIELSERELRRRIALIEPGEYRATTWSEWGDRFVVTPCRLEVTDDRLIFDFDGAAAQIPFFINSQPYIIKTLFMPQLISTLAPDLPFNEGLVAPIELRCPEHSVVHASAPAPMNCGHMHLGGAAAEAMYRCLRLALWASPQYSDAIPSMGAEGFVALATNSWFGVDSSGGGESWMMTDGVMTGANAFRGADGVDFAMKSLEILDRDMVQPGVLDIESYEACYPILMRERRMQPGGYGAGQWRSGGSLAHSFEPHGADELVGQMLGVRGHLPLNGEAGGDPGAVTQLRIHRRDGRTDAVTMAAADVALRKGEVFELQAASAGGWGDPLDRDPGVVADDVLVGRLSAKEAAARYGVVLLGGKGDLAATDKRRRAIRRSRLAEARPARRPVGGPDFDADAPTQPLYPGVVQQGDRAYGAASGALLALAPNPWTDGCVVLERHSDEFGPTVLVRSYLDPISGAALMVEAAPADVDTTCGSAPRRWTAAATGALAEPSPRLEARGAA
jgi:N-methylhydantoinase B